MSLKKILLQDPLLEYFHGEFCGFTPDNLSDYYIREMGYERALSKKIIKGKTYLCFVRIKSYMVCCGQKKSLEAAKNLCKEYFRKYN